MKKIRFFLALWAAKFSILMLKITKHNGTNFPGALALKICPDIMEYISKPNKNIVITGTNGKTTVSNMIIDMLKQDGIIAVNNSLGSNIVTGISTTLIYGVNLFNKSKYEYGVIELDERSALKVFPYINPEYMIITNLSRDSIMRNAHPEYIADFLTDYIPKNTKLIINADDLIASGVSTENERVYFGIDKMDTDVTECINLINDLQICPKCHNKLNYEYLRYHHIGKAYCPECGFSSPAYNYEGYDASFDKMTIKVKDADGYGEYQLLNDSIFNLYNVVAAVALFRQMGYSHERIEELLNKITIVKSRYELRRINDKTITMQMGKDKNAFANSRAFDYIAGLPGDKEIILMMNSLGDVKHWSENTCWLYDCDFEFLNDDKIKHIIATGPRSQDYILRLLIAGVKPEKLSCTARETDTPEMLKLFDNDNVYILFGTDSIELANKVAEKTEKLMRGKTR